MSIQKIYTIYDIGSNNALSDQNLEYKNDIFLAQKYAYVYTTHQLSITDTLKANVHIAKRKIKCLARQNRSKKAQKIRDTAL